MSGTIPPTQTIVANSSEPISLSFIVLIIILIIIFIIAYFLIRRFFDS
jgi:flagellar biogenesis protein FliO